KTQFPTERGTVRAVDGVDLTIESGEFVGLVGESGSGKSVLADSIMRIVDEPGKIVEGDIRLYGKSILGNSEREMAEIRGGKISRIFQDPMNSLNPILTVGEQVAEAIQLHQESEKSITLPSEIKRKILGVTSNSRVWKQAIDMLETV